MTSRHVVATVVIDLSKAFDTIKHNLLIEKLDAYGIHKIELSWFSDYTYLKKRQRMIDTRWRALRLDFIDKLRVPLRDPF